MRRVRWGAAAQARQRGQRAQQGLLRAEAAPEDRGGGPRVRGPPRHAACDGGEPRMRRSAACRLLEEEGRGIEAGSAGIQPHPDLTRKCTRLVTCCGQLQLDTPWYSWELLRSCSPALGHTLLHVSHAMWSRSLPPAPQVSDQGRARLRADLRAGIGAGGELRGGGHGGVSVRAGRAQVLLSGAQPPPAGDLPSPTPAPNVHRRCRHSLLKGTFVRVMCRQVPRKRGSSSCGERQSRVLSL